MLRRAVVLTVLAAITFSGCTRAPAASGDANASATPLDQTPTAVASPSPAPTATPAASLDPEVEQAVTFRRTFGLRFDLPFVIASLTDPKASNYDFGLPVYPDEATKLFADLAEQNATIPIVVDYALAHPDESGGVYIDRDEHVGMVTSLWTDHLAEHAAALAKLLDGRVTLVRQVRYSEAELRVLQETIFADRDWMEAIPARMQGLGVGILENAITMDVSSAEPTAVQQIVDHYGLGDKLVVTSDGTGAALIPGGNVKGKVRLKNGNAPGPNANLQIDYLYEPDVPGSCGGGDMGYGVREDGTFDYPCQAGERILVIYGEGREELGRATVNVIAGKTVTVTIRLTKDP
jgi:hypothetical protein